MKFPMFSVHSVGCTFLAPSGSPGRKVFVCESVSAALASTSGP